MTTHCEFTSHDEWKCPAPPLPTKSHCLFHVNHSCTQTEIQVAKEWLAIALKAEELQRFDGYIFRNDFSFDHIDINCSVHFRGCRFHHPNFCGTNFKGKETIFDEAIFEGQEAIFTDSKFPGETVSFHNARFRSNKTTFDLAQFTNPTGSVDFEESEFSGSQGVSFSQTRFPGESTNFSKSKFLCEELFFLNTNFESRETSFFESVFKGSVVFVVPDGPGDLMSFKEARFHGNTQFSSPNLHHSSLAKHVDFVSVSFSEKGHASFHTINLGKTSFFKTNLRNIEFHNVSWNTPKRRSQGWRNRLYDEELWLIERGKGQHINEIDLTYIPELSAQYRFLKLHYRDNGDLVLMGHFHYGLMECEWYREQLQAREENRSKLSLCFGNGFHGAVFIDLIPGMAKITCEPENG